MTLRILALAFTILGSAMVPNSVSAQPGSQSYYFYGEEPWGGSYLGVDTRDVSADRLGQLHLSEEQGVEITMVDQDAPAGKAGLKEHDVILTVNDQKVESVEQLRRLIREIPPGRTANVGISRDGQKMTVKAQLAKRSNMPNMDQSFNFTVPPVNIPAVRIPPINMPEIDVPVNVLVIHSPVRSGLMVENLTPQLGEFFGVKTGNGVLVRSVEKGSRAEQAGFRAGDVVVKVNGSAVNDCSDFTRLLRNRNENKASITVMRDRKEQNLTLTLPEPRRSGSLKNEECDDLTEVACAEVLKDKAAEIAPVMPEITTAEIKRIKPEMERLQKEVQQEFLEHRDELKKEMENLQQELRDQQEELNQQMKDWARDADI
jgi:serine protease Do